MFEVVHLKFENFVIAVSFKYFIDNENIKEVEEYKNDNNYVVMTKQNSDKTQYITTVYKNNVVLTYNNGLSYNILCQPALMA
ncbi:hypothetical protein DDB_G0278065 [Dictyostelium discoideum AX4]|uniref:Uncharacterized protein n=1 Tax=Dictyostelium discoideum TaxID=44689 RepID=Q54YV3_DICDI|nr:hypothetical protein DDB_G0278065 [Dictyostelium discoideum AX4]EAL68205.1 hypothetical protein DDB_G0278065 [Dictyostelium discoideum AX4]|eukprot:XP_642099.1 hypothetical protein DDB_G0278065 [Dictyostelium discoideum AX4]